MPILSVSHGYLQAQLLEHTLQVQQELCEMYATADQVDVAHTRQLEDVQRQLASALEQRAQLEHRIQEGGDAHASAVALACREMDHLHQVRHAGASDCDADSGKFIVICEFVIHRVCDADALYAPDDC